MNDEITGFDNQMGALPIRPLLKKITTAVRPSFAPKVTPSVRPNFAAKAVAPITQIKQAAQAIKSKATSVIKPVASKGFFTPATMAIKKLQVPNKTMTALKSLKSNVTRQATAQIKQGVPQAIAVQKANATYNDAKSAVAVQAQALPVNANVQSTLATMTPIQTANTLFNQPVTPQLVNKLDSIQKSYLRTDLPYQKVPVNSVTMIEPSVDAGTQDYYGK
jgi:hypothetical protein